MYTYKTLIRDKLVDDTGAGATIATYFGAAGAGTTTSSCRVNMDNLAISAAYPQILIGYDAGETTPNLDADQGRIFLTIECIGTGTTHAYKELGKFRSRIINLIDDKALRGSSGGGATTTGVCYLFRKFSEVEGFDEEREVYWLRMGFNGEFLQQASLP